MKVIENTDMDIQTNIEGKKIAMSIDSSASGHLMGMMTRLYSDPIMAVVREYSTNAWDAQVEAGTTDKPIRVTTPKALFPFFEVEDLGIGMDAETIEQVYSRYGTSTKRDTNAQSGMLGMGCKSALAYTPQFTIVSVKDGVRTQVVVGYDTADALKVPFMTIVAEDKTDLPSGTKITIPVRSVDISLFSIRAQHFFRFWDEGTVLVDGQVPEGLASVLRIDGEVQIVSGVGDHIVMGNVAYPASQRFSRELHYSYGVIVNAPIGSVAFTPSRESLEYNTTTKTYIDSIKERLSNESISKQLKSEYGKCKSLHDAVDRFIQISKPFHAYDLVFEYEGRKYDGSFNLGSLDGFQCWIPGSPLQLSQHSRIPSIAVTDIQAMTKVVFIVNYDRPSFTPGQKKKINYFRQANHSDLEINNYVLMGGDNVPDYVPESRIWDWKADIEPIKPPRTASTSSSRRRKSIPGSYYVATPDSPRAKELAASSIDASKPIYFIQYEGAYHAFPDDCATWVEDDSYVAFVGARRLPKFRKLFPDAKDFFKHRSEAQKKWLTARADDGTLSALRYNYQRDFITARLAAPQWKSVGAKIEDPEIRSVIEDVLKANACSETDVLRYKSIVRCNLDDAFDPKNVPLTDRWENAVGKYPLLNRKHPFEITKLDHFVEYVNYFYSKDHHNA